MRELEDQELEAFLDEGYCQTQEELAESLKQPYQNVEKQSDIFKRKPIECHTN